MIRQQQLLMKTENIDLIFTDDAIEELATVAAEVHVSSIHYLGCIATLSGAGGYFLCILLYLLVELHD